MRLYKRGQYWWCSFPWQGETVRRSTRCTTRTAALLTAQRWERERADPDHAAAASATFGGAVTAFLADLERSDKPQATRQFYKRKSGTLVRILGAERPLSEVNAQLVDKYIATREGEAVAFDAVGIPTRYVSANTIHKELVTLRQVLKRAKRRGEFRRDVSEVLPVGFSPRYVPRRTSLTLEQAGRLVLALPPHRGAAVAFSLATTARFAEVFRATRDDITITDVALRGTKTQGSERVVKTPNFADPLLKFAKENGDGKGRMLFRPWPNSNRDIAAACRRIGTPEVSWNDLRRTMSTWLLEGGVSTYLVSKMLGHTTTKMLETVYGHPRDEVTGRLIDEQSKAIPALTIGGKGERQSTRGPLEHLDEVQPAALDGAPSGAAVEAGEGGAGRPECTQDKLGPAISQRILVAEPDGAGAAVCAHGPGAEDLAGRNGRRDSGAGEGLVRGERATAIDVHLVHAFADEQEPPQPIATFEQDENHRENNGNAVGPVGIEPTTKGLKVQRTETAPPGWEAYCPYCKCSLVRGCAHHQCVACMGHLARYVRAVDVCPRCGGSGEDPEHAGACGECVVDVQQTSSIGAHLDAELATRGTDDGGPSGQDAETRASLAIDRHDDVSDKVPDVEVEAVELGVEVDASAADVSSVRAGNDGGAEGNAGCSLHAQVTASDARSDKRRSISSEGAGSPEEPPFSDTANPCPMCGYELGSAWRICEVCSAHRLGRPAPARAGVDAYPQLRGACRAALAALHGGRVP